MICPSESCKHENADGEEFCEKCGSELKPEPQQSTIATEAESPPTPADAPLTEPLLAETPVEQQPPDPAAIEEMKFMSAPSYPVTVSVAGITDAGLSGKNNEDTVIVDSAAFPHLKIRLDFVLVLDGMGGEQAGEILSRQAGYDIAAGLWFLVPSFEISQKFVSRLDFWRLLNIQFGKFLNNQVASANDRVVRYGKAKKLKQGHYGATLVMAVVVTDLETGRVMVHGYNAGDARCYLVVDNEVTQISEDHVLGQMIGNNMVKSPCSFLGAYDHLTGKPFSFETWMSDSNQQTVALVLCTDGGWNMIGPDPLPQFCQEHEDADAIAQALLSASLVVEVPYGRAEDPRTQTGDDNITFGVVKISIKKKG